MDVRRNLYFKEANTYSVTFVTFIILPVVN
jgi:hypothetical protein